VEVEMLCSENKKRKKLLIGFSGFSLHSPYVARQGQKDNRRAGAMENAKAGKK
jgi:hypothetical protein